MPRELALGLRLTADGKGFVGAIRVSEDALKRLRGEAEKGRGATRHYGAASDQVAAGNEKVQRSLLAIHTPLLKYSGYLAGALSLRGLVRHADEFTSIANAVRLATDNTAEFNQVQDALFAIAQRTRAPIAAVADLYQKLTISANELGASQQELLDTVAGVGQALVINGSSAAAASGALLQFSQLLGSARIEAEEFNSLLDGAKPIFQVVADNLDAAGGSVSRLRDLVRQGAVTNKDFFQALQRGLPTLEAAFSQTASTIGQASIQMSNAITRAIGSLDSAVDASDTLAAGISDLAYALSLTAKGELEHDFKRLGYAAGAFLVLIGTRLSPAVLRWTTTAGKAVQANYALHASLGRMTGATASATAGWFVLKRAVVAGQGALAALGGPLGLGLLAAYALYEFAAAGHKARDSLNGLDPRVDDLTLSIDQYRESLERLNRVQLNELISSTAEQLRGLEEGRDQLLAQLARGATTCCLRVLSGVLMRYRALTPLTRRKSSICKINLPTLKRGSQQRRNGSRFSSRYCINDATPMPLVVPLLSPVDKPVPVKRRWALPDAICRKPRKSISRLLNWRQSGSGCLQIQVAIRLLT